MESLNLVVYNGLIAGVIQKFEFTYELSWEYMKIARNRTSHTYDFDTAEKVYEVSKEFLVEVKKLYRKIELKNE